MARHKKFTPSGAKAVCKLQKKIFFEKTLLASAVISEENDKCELNLPSWFIKKHGEKIGKRAILRYQSSIWIVKVIIHWSSSKYVSVRFGSGWRDFATFHALSKGDSLMFTLIADSEFEVYLKSESSLRPARKHTCDSEVARKKTKPSHESRDLASDHRSSSCDLSKLHFVESENDRDSSSGDHHDSQTVYKSAMSEFDPDDDHAQHSDARTEKANKNEAFAHEKETLEETLSSKLPCFFKKLTASHIYMYCLEIPCDFWKTYSSQLHSVVKLQGIHEDSEVQTVACKRMFQRTQMQVKLGAGWKKFVDENNLEVGQELSFTLTGNSFFVVREVL